MVIATGNIDSLTKRLINLKRTEFNDGSENLKNRAGLKIEFFHVPSSTTAIFKAWLTDFNDSFTTNWTEESVYGRSDPIATYGHTKRVISLAWDVIAGGLLEAYVNMSEIEKLVRMCYPNYQAGIGGATNITSAPLIKLKFLNLVNEVTKGGHPGSFIGDAKVSGLVGKINGVTFKPDLAAGMFQDKNHILLPKVVKLNVEFTVFHTHALGWDQHGFRTSNYPYGYKVIEDADADEGRAAAKTVATISGESSEDISFDVSVENTIQQQGLFEEVSVGEYRMFEAGYLL